MLDENNSVGQSDMTPQVIPQDDIKMKAEEILQNKGCYINAEHCGKCNNDLEHCYLRNIQLCKIIYGYEEGLKSAKDTIDNMKVVDNCYWHYHRNEQGYQCLGDGTEDCCSVCEEWKLNTF